MKQSWPFPSGGSQSSRGQRKNRQRERALLDLAERLWEQPGDVLDPGFGIKEGFLEEEMPSSYHPSCHVFIREIFIEPLLCQTWGIQRQTNQTSSLPSWSFYENQGRKRWWNGGKKEWHLARESNKDKITQCSASYLQGLQINFQSVLWIDRPGYLNLGGISATCRWVKAGCSTIRSDERLYFLIPCSYPYV